MTEAINVLNHTYDELQLLLSQRGFPLHVAGKILENCYREKKGDPLQWKGIKKEYRLKLKSQLLIPNLHIRKIQQSQTDGSLKYLFELEDGHCVESVCIPAKEKISICVSSQVGCRIGCRFCATAKQGFTRNLKTHEIVNQARIIQRDVNKPLDNIVFMGMGEPFLNYKEVIRAADIFNSDFGYNVGARKITISTAGIVPFIRKFSEEGRRYGLAVSLNSLTQSLRDELMPGVARYTLDDVIKSVHYYQMRLKKNVTFTYILLPNWNMGASDIQQLKDFLKGGRFKLNLIPYNGLSTDPFLSPSEEEIRIFRQGLLDIHLPVHLRKTVGREIQAACGQLACTKEG